MRLLLLLQGRHAHAHACKRAQPQSLTPWCLAFRSACRGALMSFRRSLEGAVKCACEEGGARDGMGVGRRGGKGGATLGVGATPAGQQQRHCMV